MRKFGLIGFPLKHSFSVAYFDEKFRKEGVEDCSYQAFPLEDINAFRQLLDQHPSLCGLNVTIPHKEAVIPFLDELDPVAEAIGAVNCISIVDGRLTGYNTDSYGFLTSLHEWMNRYSLTLPAGALILGTGGASKAVAYSLRKLGVDVQFVSRRPGPGLLTYEDLDEEVMRQHALIVNTTPLGTWPDVDSCPPLPWDTIGRMHLLYDLVYNPPETKFLQLGRQHGAATTNGLRMLELQADRSWEIWNG
ncbi:MAG: shikimate dehydrogenase [Saprospiraceae bacterium]